MNEVEERALTRGEELANSISHGVGFVASMVAIPILIRSMLGQGTAWNVIGVTVFAISSLLLYLASTIYHALPPSRVKCAFRIVDHAAIYILIAGTYTPFTLGVLRGAWGWTLFALIWAIAIFGVVFKIFGGLRYPNLSTALYLVMGWLVVIAIKPMILLVPTAGLIWILAGGVCYTGGVWFYRADWMKYAHLAWHVCVLAGTTCHFFAVLWYSA